MKKKWIAFTVAAAVLALANVGLGVAQASNQLKPAGTAANSSGAYLTGDFHNHTPFSDGTASVPLLIGKSMQYNLDWFAQSGHGGPYSRDGRYSDPEYDGSGTGEGKFLDETVGAAAFKGDDAGTQYGHKSMWRWQSLQNYLYPYTWQNSITLQKPIWSGVEWEVPGHEHCSVGIIDGQFDGNGVLGNADALAQFEYLFDMEDNDTSAGGGQGWTGKIPNPPKTPTADYPHPGIQGHAKAVAAVTWLEQNHRYTSYAVFAHIERKNVWSQDRGGNNTGYNVEHFRDFNNAAPDICFGFEGQPGHQAQVYVSGSEDRGGFGPGVYGGSTFGGTGYYCATIGHMWDALLGEGRNWWLFASSDFHSRSVPEYESSDYPATDPNSTNPVQDTNTLNNGWRGATASTADFWPGEYQKDYVFANCTGQATAQEVLDGMRSGNSFIVQGDLIRGLQFTAATASGPSATMGEQLLVSPKQQVTVKIKVYIPDLDNNCPYTFNNPSLAQVSVNQPLNHPVLHHVDLIGGEVYGKRIPGTDAYNDPTNPTTSIKQTVLVSSMTDEGNGWKSFTYTFNPARSCYFRLRGTNLPPNTPNETDVQGNPLADTLSYNIKYTHPTLGANTPVDGDVEAWADLWFYSNPVFIKVSQSMDYLDQLLFD